MPERVRRLIRLYTFSYNDVEGGPKAAFKSRIERAIGVCSSFPPHFEAFKDVSDVIPAVNQFEISPLNVQDKLIKYCKDRGICVEAMSTFSHFRSNEPRKEIFENEILMGIAQDHNKSVAQVVLRWLVQKEIAVIPKTWNFEHLAENIDVENFTLSEDEMKRIDSLDQGKFLNYHPDRWLHMLPAKYQGRNLF